MKKLLTAFTLLSVLVLAPGCIVTTQDGEQVGYITTAETNGIIFKADVVYIKSKLDSSQEELYCVGSKDAFKGLKDARDKEQKVKIKYHSEAITMNGCENIVDSFEIL